MTLLYLIIKAIHVIAVISWMAGLLYLPRLFVYHVDAESGGEADKMFTIMEERLLKIIMGPAMMVSWLAGLYLLWRLAGTGVFSFSFWVYAKIVLVILMTVFHGFLARCRKDFAAGVNQRSARFFRIANEVPTLLMIAVVVLVIVRPF